MPQFVIIARDGTDPEALNRRMQARDAHVRTLDTLRREGKAVVGVALTDDSGKMTGSVVVTNFESRAALDGWLKEEPYVVGKVWEHIEIIPGKLGPSFADLVKS
jgi:uncharacterized protein YciI